jgi:hypothetical protein
MTYTCPMHPEVREDRAGKCPKCGMDLVPAGTTPHSGRRHVRRRASSGNGVLNVEIRKRAGTETELIESGTRERLELSRRRQRTWRLWGERN